VMRISPNAVVVPEFPLHPILTLIAVTSFFAVVFKKRKSPPNETGKPA